MGTKLQYALNLLSTPSNNHDRSINIETTDAWVCSRKSVLKDSVRIGFNQLQESMDRMLQQYNRESLKKTMLNQEEIFKEQVRELHRLYTVQKTLMSDLRNQQLKLSSSENAAPGDIRTRSSNSDVDTRSAFRNTAAGSPTSCSPFSSNHHSASQTNLNYDFHQQFKMRAGTSSQELTSCSGDTSKLQRGFDLKQPTEEEISTNIDVLKGQDLVSSRPKMDKMKINDPQGLHYCDDGECDIELTLSIGYNTHKLKPKNHSCSNSELGCSESIPYDTMQLIPSTSVRSDRDEECSVNSAAPFDQETLQRPQWLFQSMSLNRM